MKSIIMASILFTSPALGRELFQDCKTIDHEDFQSRKASSDTARTMVGPKGIYMYLRPGPDVECVFMDFGDPDFVAAHPDWHSSFVAQIQDKINEVASVESVDLFGGAQMAAGLTRALLATEQATGDGNLTATAGTSGLAAPGCGQGCDADGEA